MSMDSSRTAYFDYMRVSALFLITLVHVAAYSWYYTPVEGFTWLALDFYKVLGRPPVLLFIMISGALFLGREIPLKKLYGKYIPRLVIAFLFWNLVYSAVHAWGKGLTGILAECFYVNYHFWFLLTIIGLYICMPLLNKIAANEKILRYFLVISFIFAFAIPEMLDLCQAFGSEGVVKYAGIIGGHIYDMHLDMFLGYPFYFLGGYYLSRQELGKKTRVIIYILGIAALAAGVLLTWADARQAGCSSDTFNSAFTIHELLWALALFTAFKYGVKGKNPRLNRVAAALSKYTFGAYLMHDLIITSISDLAGITALSFNPLVSVPVISLATVAVGYVLSFLINKIPFVNRYIV